MQLTENVKGLKARNKTVIRRSKAWVTPLLSAVPGDETSALGYCLDSEISL
jgi:hypothetical protein